MNKFEINIDNFHGGFCPAFWTTTYNSYGNKNQCSDMQNVDLTSPTFMTQGPGLANLTNGTEAGEVSTLIKGMLDYAQASGVSFGIGGGKLYKFSSTAVTSDASFPRTITNATDGQDVAYYRGKIYYSYNKASGGDIGQLTLPGTFADDWGSSHGAIGAALQGGVPHPLLAAGNDMLYCGNKSYLTSYDGLNDVFTEKDLDLPADAVIQDLAWAQNKIWIATNKPDISGTNKNVASIYVWDGNSPSWDEEILVMGRIGAITVKGGVVFVFYEDITSTGGFKLGYLSGLQIVDVAHFTGSLPAFYQVTEYKNLITWISSGEVWAWGSVEKDVPVTLSQLADGGYSTVGGISCPFGTPIIASNQTTSYKLAKFSGYDTACYWYSMTFDITGNGRRGFIDKIKFNFEKLATGARVDYTLKDNKGTSLKTGTISFTDDGAITTKDFFPKAEGENFRLELSWANGSTTNPVSIRNVRIFGHILQ
jgi:hypothetical protein